MRLPNLAMPVSALALTLALAVPAPAAWTEARSGRIVVVGDATEEQQREFLRRFELLRALFASRGARTDPGKELVVYAMRDRESLRQLLEGLEREDRRGIFLAGDDRDVLALSVDARESVHPYAAGLHEYTHALHRLNYARMPAWLNEGLAELHSTLSGDARQVEWGRLRLERLATLRSTFERAGGRAFASQREELLVEPNAQEALNAGSRSTTARRTSQARRRLLPLDELFGITQRSETYERDEQADMFYAQSAALCHMLLADGFEASPLAPFVTASAERVLTAGFRLDASDELQERLRLYVRRATYRPYPPFESEIDASVPEPEVRTLDRGEAEARQADFLLRVGLAERARDSLERARGNATPPPLALEVLGAFLEGGGPPDAAFGVLVEAVRGPSPSAAALFRLGRLALRSDRAEWETTGITALLNATRAAPTFAAAHADLARHFLGQPEAVLRGCGHAVRAAEAEPGTLDYEADRLRCLVRSGDPDAASSAEFLGSLDVPVVGAATAMAEAAALAGDDAGVEAALTSIHAWSDEELLDAVIFHREAGHAEIGERLLAAARRVRPDAAALHDDATP